MTQELTGCCRGAPTCQEGAAERVGFLHENELMRKRPAAGGCARVTCLPVTEKSAQIQALNQGAKSIILNMTSFFWHNNN